MIRQLFDSVDEEEEAEITLSFTKNGNGLFAESVGMSK